MRGLFFACIVGTTTTLLSASASADEPIAAKEPRLLKETGENTTVIDAFDKDDMFDANILVSLRQSWKSANIRRETTIAQPGLAGGAFTASNENVAKYSQSLTILDVGGEIGIFRDLAFSIHLPIVLADSRELSDLDGSSKNPQRLQDPTGDQLFSVPFKSPTRSGIDQLNLGLNYAIFNQQRDESKPTWVIGAETRFAIGGALHACNENAQIKCPVPSSPGSASRDAGVSRRMNTIVASTIFSRRIGYIEPYTGFNLLVDLPQSDSDFGATNDLRGALLNRPPLVGKFTVGMEVYPWEVREDFKRVVLDFKVRAGYHSPGRDYSELFDALGSSQAKTLRNPNPGAYKSSGDFTSVADPAAGKVFFTGITDQQAFGEIGGSAGVTWQISEFTKFTAGLGLTHLQSHLVTSADACNPDFKSAGAGASGPCRVGAATSGGGSSTGIPNPNHRQTIDLPGRRFSVDDTTIVDLWLSGVVMF